MENGFEAASAFTAIWQRGVADYINAQSDQPGAAIFQPPLALSHPVNGGGGVCVCVEVDRCTLTVGRLRRLARMGRSVAKDFGRKLAAAVE